MDSWILIIVIIAALFLLSNVVKTLAGAVFRFLIFAGLAALIWRQQTGEEIEFSNLELMSALATVAALSFVATGIVVTLLFRNSRFKFLLYPLIGFGISFATVSVIAMGGT